MAELASITSKDVRQQITIRVKVDRIIGIRFWLLARLMRFAAWVGGVGLEIDIRDKGQADAN